MEYFLQTASGTAGKAASNKEIPSGLLYVTNPMSRYSRYIGQARFRCKRVRFHAAEQTAIEVENEPSVDPESPQDKENRRSRLQLLADRFRNICDSSNAGGSNSPRQNTKRSPSTGASISKATSPSSDASPARCASPVVSLNSPAVPQQRSPLKRSQSSPMGLCSTVILKDMKTTELGEDVQALVQRARNQAFEEASILTADYEDLVKRHKVVSTAAEKMTHGKQSQLKRTPIAVDKAP